MKTIMDTLIRTRIKIIFSSDGDRVWGPWRRLNCSVPEEFKNLGLNHFLHFHQSSPVDDTNDNQINIQSLSALSCIMMITYGIKMSLVWLFFKISLDDEVYVIVIIIAVVIVIAIRIWLVDQVYSRMWEFMSSRDHVLTSSTRVLRSSSSFSSFSVTGGYSL